MTPLDLILWALAAAAALFIVGVPVLLGYAFVKAANKVATSKKDETIL